MKILVIGDLEQARTLLEPEGKQARTVFHCRKDTRFTRSFSPIEPPDWVLIEEKALSGNDWRLLQSLRAMDFYTLQDHDAGNMTQPGDQDASRAAGCRLERDARGQMRLHCGLRCAPRAHTRAVKRDPDQGEAAICFEYQAPLRRHGN